MRLFRLVVAGLSWALAVVVVAALSWFAIDSAGQQVSVNVVDVGVSTSLARTTQPTASSHSASEPQTNPSAGVGVALQATPDSPSHSPSVTSRPTGRTSTPTKPSERPQQQAQTEPTSPPAPTAQPVQGWVPTSGGLVQVQCTGGLITDYTVSPNGGWGLQIALQPAGQQPTLMVVVFTRDRSYIRVQASCPGGQPGFQVKSSGSGGGDD